MSIWFIFSHISSNLSIKDILSTIEFSQESIGAVILTIIASSIVIEITPIKINPISWVLSWVGDRINDKLNKKIDAIDKKLDNHIQIYTGRWVQELRGEILIFANECTRGINHSREQFEFVLKECDLYEEHITSTHQSNGVMVEAMSLIRRQYANKLATNGFIY
jgi:hypothetical protein|nr:MAG TPA: hypothetical protein [Caudoviricetes sp.]